MSKITIAIYERLLSESFKDLDDEFSMKDMFYSILRNMANANGGWLKLTHEAPREVREKIQSKGILNLEHGIYAFVGWNEGPQWMKPGMGDVWHFVLPMRLINSDYIVPDDRFGTDGYEDFLAEFPDVVGGEVGINLESIPPKWIRGRQ